MWTEVPSEGVAEERAMQCSRGLLRVCVPSAAGRMDLNVTVERNGEKRVVARFDDPDDPASRREFACALVS